LSGINKLPYFGSDDFGRLLLETFHLSIINTSEKNKHKHLITGIGKIDYYLKL